MSWNLKKTKWQILMLMYIMFFVLVLVLVLFILIFQVMCFNFMLPKGYSFCQMLMRLTLLKNKKILIISFIVAIKAIVSLKIFMGTFWLPILNAQCLLYSCWTSLLYWLPYAPFCLTRLLIFAPSSYVSSCLKLLDLYAS